MGVPEDFLYHYMGVCQSVTDGDTAKIELDFGFSLHQKMIVRLLGINAPELHADDPKPGLAARDYLKGLIEGKQIIVKTKKDESEKYGRTLAEIFLPGDAVSVNQKLVERGLAVPYFGGPR